MSNFNISRFTAEVNAYGLARPSRFEVIITPPRSILGLASTSRTVSLFCDATILPGMSIITKQLKSFGPAYQRPVSVEYGGDAINMAFYIDTQMWVKAFFDAWMTKIVNWKSFTVEYQSEYVSQIEIRQLDEKDNVTYSVILEDAFPRSINMLDLNSSSANQAHKLSVIFAYRRWIPTHDIFSSVQNYTNPQLTDTLSFQPTENRFSTYY